ncbi:MAG: hypothetical protein HYR73_05790 [Candidatus Eisenbacteria bacterium]|nr:hypothetical protein [Candidatus Eisenbacteria bacterium]
MRLPLAVHFSGKPKRTRGLFDAWRAFVRRAGPFHVYAQKTRIVFMTRARFAGAMIRRDWIDAALWLKRRAEHPLLTRVEYIPPGNWAYRFRLTDRSQLDRALLDLVRESYAVGKQEHGMAARAQDGRRRFRAREEAFGRARGTEERGRRPRGEVAESYVI